MLQYAQIMISEALLPVELVVLLDDLIFFGVGLLYDPNPMSLLPPPPIGSPRPVLIIPLQLLQVPLVLTDLLQFLDRTVF